MEPHFTLTFNRKYINIEVNINIIIFLNIIILKFYYGYKKLIVEPAGFI